MRFKVLPAQTGPLLPTVGAAGVKLTVALVVALVDVHPLTVTFTLYVPEAFVVALAMDGFWAEEVKLLGPVQL